ncbi:unnamed protein product [Euphydryas editha]|uniref:Uncharacterized protein n=1 Tax=Euphydryas editha TaxID=104508 RepID=A0AAU9TVE9_EUPED|nr:unnamed protein product [Euphydryas editha]
MNTYAKTLLPQTGIDASDAKESRSSSSLNPNNWPRSDSGSSWRRSLEGGGLSRAFAEGNTKVQEPEGYLCESPKKVATGMKEVVEELASRNTIEEVVQLRALVAELRRVEKRFLDLKTKVEKQMEKLMQSQAAAPTKPRKSDDWEEREQSLVVKIGNMLNARIEALNNRLLPERTFRPPLAADQRREALASESAELHG